MKISRKSKAKATQKGKTRSELANIYTRFFSPSPSIANGYANDPLEQGDSQKSMRTFVTYSIGERPIINYLDA